LRHAAVTADQSGLMVAAGHGLDYKNVKSVVEILQVEEVNIGFSVIAQALTVGLEQAVRQMIGLLNRQKIDAHKDSSKNHTFSNR